MGSGEWGNGYRDRERSWGDPTPRPETPRPGPTPRAEPPRPGPTPRSEAPRPDEQPAPPPDLWSTGPDETWQGGGGWSRHPSRDNPVVEPDEYYLPQRSAGWGRTAPGPVAQPPARRPSLASAVTGTGRMVPRGAPPAPVPVTRAVHRRAAEPAEEEEEYEDPAYGRVLLFTLAWFGVPSVLYLIWMLTLTGDRRTIALHTFSSGIAWLAGAGILSLIVSAILRWAVTGWRALTISFAGAVIGAGVATIAHSLAFSP